MARDPKPASIDRPDQLDGAQKAAVILLALGEEHTHIWESLDDEEIKEISQAMSNLGAVAPQCVEQLIVDFVGKLSSAGSIMGSYDATQRLLSSFLPTDKIESIMGIMNGTANYILTRMTDEGAPFADVLKDAQEQGFAEADPTYDVEGIDTAHKLVILMTIAYGTHIHLDHGGGAGRLARVFPRARVVCHPPAAKHLADPPPPLQESAPDTPAEVVAIVERMMAKDPALRIDSESRRSSWATRVWGCSARSSPS